jgi:hypothetical protein
MINEKIVEQHLRDIFGLWHGCAMSLNPRSKNFLTLTDIERGLKEGQLCDDCESQIAAHMLDMRTEHYNEHDLYFHDDIW